MKIASTVNAETIGWLGQEIHRGEDGLFDVPEELGKQLLRFSTWVEPYVAQASELAAKAAQELDPHTLAARVAELEAKLAEAVASKIEDEKAAKAAEKPVAAKPAAKKPVSK